MTRVRALRRKLPQLPMGLFAVVFANGASGAALTEQPAGSPASTQTGPEAVEQDIVVVASPQERGSIDRTTYLVKDIAEARASTALDLLGRVPTVEVSPSGAVRLIGRGGVSIQIDGQEVPNANAFLRAMQGSQVAKIEVVTNPSAQFSARGTGGIINIVTRRSSGAGPGGSVMAKVGSTGSYEARSSPSWTRGKLSLSGSIGVAREKSRGEAEEEWETPGPGGAAGRFESEELRGDSDQASASVRASIELAPKQSLSIDALAAESESHSSAEADIVADGSSSEERSSARSDGSVRRAAIAYRREGSRPGRQTSVSASHTSFDFAQRRSSVTDGEESSRFDVSSDTAIRETLVKADQVRPSGERRLSVGGQVQHHVEEFRQLLSIGSPPAAPLTTDDAFAASWTEAEAYLTYQWPFRGTRILAGARIASRWHDIEGASDDPRQRLHLFPSLHAERQIHERLTLNLSYSSRIGWPGLAQLDPRLRFSDRTNARAGNPSLRPEKTHSLELKLNGRAGAHEADLIAYVQWTRDLRSELAELDGEVLVSRPVNLGRRTAIGTSLNLRGPLASGLRYTATAYLAWDRFDGGGLTGIDEAGTRYGGSLQLDYRDGIEGRAGADQLRLTGRLSGPSETGLTRMSTMISADASWSHALTDRLAAVLTASHVLKSPRLTYFAPDLISRFVSRQEGPRVSLALTYSLSPVAP